MKQLIRSTWFWDKVTKTFGSLAGLESVIYGSGKFEINPNFAVTIGVFTWIGIIIGHWCTDNDNNGVVDFFQVPPPESE